ncbi:MAG: outer membrane beta-barrel protein [Runella sp.]
MYSTHLRYLFDIRWQKIRHCIIIGLLLLMAAEVHAQNAVYRRKHLEYYDDKPIHYGFLFAAPFTRFHHVHNNAFLRQDSTSRITAPTTTGFRVGFVVNAYLTDHWDIRSTPTIALYDRVMEYEYARGGKRRELREATWLEIPLLFKYKSQRRHNSRMYMIGGATLGLETNVRQRIPQGNERLNTRGTDLTIDYGFGFEQFLAYTKISPEIRFSHGIVNLYNTTDPLSNVGGIRRLTSHTVSLYIMFE